MRSRALLPLAALAIGLAFPASAETVCAASALDGVPMVANCSTPTVAGLDRCKIYLGSFVARCAEDYKAARVEVKVLGGKDKRTDDEEKRYRAALARADEINNVRTAAEAASRAATSDDSYKLARYPAFLEVAGSGFQLDGQLDLALGDAEHKADKVFQEQQRNVPDAGEPVPPKISEPERNKILIIADRTGAALKRRGGPPDPVTSEKIGELYLTAGANSKAEEIGQQLVKTSPKDARGPSLLARAALGQGRPEDAMKWAQKALELDPNDKNAKDALAFARSQLSASRLRKPAVPALGELRPADSRDLPGASRSAGPGVAQAATGVLPGAAPPRPVPAMIRRAHEKSGMGDLAGALLDVSTYLDEHPDDDEARLLRADLQLRLGKWKQAKDDAEKVLAKSPDDARALRVKAAALLELGEITEALSVVERALMLEPASGLAHLIHARILERLGKIAEAVAEYREAALLDSALEAVAEEALKRLGAGPAPAPPPVKRELVRGSLLVLSLSLVLLGLAGGAIATVRRRTRAAAAAPSRQRERTLRAGDLVASQYRIVRELGRGGMGVVFEAVDENLKRPVALKQLQGDYRASAEDAARFLQEARLVAQLRHPNVAEIYAAVEDAGLYLVFELVRGRSLDTAIGSLKPEQARGIVSASCAALTAAHARRIVHRDLKPSNVMISEDGEVKIMDFGIAHQARGAATMTQTSASGTPPYMAPEQAMGSVSSASDLYALGVMAYELLAGTRPFDGPDYLGPKMRGDFPRVTSRGKPLPAKLDYFFASALSPDPAKRPRDAAAFAAAFAACFET
jgi:tetratricopeptide (TPR) repeat protein